jgi:hypothetical protein
MTITETHIAECKHRAFPHTDAAKRMADGINQCYADHGINAVNFWKAIRLTDGSVDRSNYETKRDAIQHQSDEFTSAYIKLTFQLFIPVCEAEMMLKFYRAAYDAGHRLIDPDAKTGGRSHILPRTMADMNRAIAGLTVASRKRR